MKNLFLSCLFAVGLLFGQSNGLYQLVGKGGTSIVDVKGNPYQINLKKKYPFNRTFVFAIDNENSKFYAEFIVKKYGKNKEPQILCINKKFYRASGWGSSNGNYSVSFELVRNEAEDVAQALGVPCNKRKHFGQVLAYDFIPLKNDYRMGDSVYVKFKISNKGDASIWYNQGGLTDNSNGRCNYFKFDVYFNGVLLPDEGPKWDFGGMESHPELKPGETDSLVECITKWTPFKNAGKYTIKCSYRLHLQNEFSSKSYPDNQADLHKAWDEKAEQTIEIIIKE